MCVCMYVCVYSEVEPSKKKEKEISEVLYHEVPFSGHMHATQWNLSIEFVDWAKKVLIREVSLLYLS